MKQIIIFVIALVIGLSSLSAQTNIGSRNAADASAALQISTTNKGLRLPKVKLDTTWKFAPLVATSNTEAIGMVVYNNNGSIIGSAAYPAYGKGLYTWDGTGWNGMPVVSAESTLPRVVLVADGDRVGRNDGPAPDFGRVPRARPMNLSRVSATGGSVTISTDTIKIGSETIMGNFININTTGTYKFNAAMSFQAINNQSNNSQVYFTLVNTLEPDDTYTGLSPNYSNQQVAWTAKTAGSEYSQFLYTGYFKAGTKLYYDAQATGLYGIPGKGSFQIASLEITRVK